MLVLSRKTNETIRIRRMWLPIEQAPQNEWVLARHFYSDLPVIARQFDGRWINDDLRKIAAPVEWQPLPRASAHPDGELVCSVTVVEIRHDKCRLGFAAADDLAIHRDEVDKRVEADQ